MAIFFIVKIIFCIVCIGNGNPFVPLSLRRYQQIKYEIDPEYLFSPVKGEGKIERAIVEKHFKVNYTSRFSVGRITRPGKWNECEYAYLFLYKLRLWWFTAWLWPYFNFPVPDTVTPVHGVRYFQFINCVVIFLISHILTSVRTTIFRLAYHRLLLLMVSRVAICVLVQQVKAVLVCPVENVSKRRLVSEQAQRKRYEVR